MDQTTEKSMEPNKDNQTENPNKNIHPPTNPRITQRHCHTNNLHHPKPQLKPQDTGEIQLDLNPNNP
jgi:hypothetical protein